MDHLLAEWISGVVGLAILGVAAAAFVSLWQDRLWLQAARRQIPVAAGLLAREWYAAGTPAVAPHASRGAGATADQMIRPRKHALATKAARAKAAQRKA